jgi:hypothetical protein
MLTRREFLCLMMASSTVVLTGRLASVAAQENYVILLITDVCPTILEILGYHSKFVGKK